jgi:hypothetical protein
LESNDSAIDGRGLFDDHLRRKDLAAATVSMLQQSLLEAAHFFLKRKGHVRAISAASSGRVLYSSRIDAKQTASGGELVQCQALGNPVTSVSSTAYNLQNKSPWKRASGENPHTHSSTFLLSFPPVAGTSAELSKMTKLSTGNFGK